MAKHKYYDEETAPLIFHCIFTYGLLPIWIIFSGIYLFKLLIAKDQYIPFLFYIELSVNIIVLVTSIVAIIGLDRWKPFSWYALLINLVTKMCYYLLFVGFSLWLGLGVSGTLWGSATAYYIVALMILVYYSRRKPLFKSKKEKVSAAVISAGSEDCQASEYSKGSATKDNDQFSEPVLIPTGEESINLPCDNAEEVDPCNSERAAPDMNMKINYCRRCGAKLLDDSIFCSNCGTKVYGL